MAARRLVIVLLVMLAVSTLAAALVPAPRRGSDTRSTRSETRRTGTAARERPARGGKLVHASIDASARPVTVRLAVGDQLSLLVRSRQADQVVVPDFGLVEPVSRDAPAQLDLLVERAGRFDVRLGETDRTVGTIVARERGGKRRSR